MIETLDPLLAYLDGAAMAYRDTAKQMRDVIQNCPVEIRDIMKNLEPFVAAIEMKAKTVYDEAERFLGPRQ